MNMLYQSLMFMLVLIISSGESDFVKKIDIEQYNYEVNDEYIDYKYNNAYTVYTDNGFKFRVDQSSDWLQFDAHHCISKPSYRTRIYNYKRHSFDNRTVEFYSPICGTCVPRVCVHLQDAMWYGMAELHTQQWPIGNVSLPRQPFVTNDLVPNNASLGNVIEPVWFNSKGVTIRASFHMVDFSYNDVNSEKMCFWRTHVSTDAWLTLKIMFSKNIKESYSKFTKQHIQLPTGVPDLRMLKSPIWSTWAKYKVDINQHKVLEFADEILKNGFSNSQLEIDDMFSTHYGDFDFNPKKFPHPADMVQKLKSKGFRVTLWITPFANLDSNAFEIGLKHGYWLKDEKGDVPALVKWWQGVGVTLDVFNTAGVEWFLGRLEKMKDLYGIDSFKFDAGEATYLPKSYDTSKSVDHNWYTREYVAAVSKLGPMIEVRCGFQTQQYPVFVRMGDKESRWGFDNGLKTLIPTVLTMGILGYPYDLPDMIGGNGYGEDTDDRFVQTVLPDRELYIRWLELTAYLPAMQFSFVPWQYDAEVVEIARRYVKIHEDVVTPILIAAAKVSMKTGAPLIRPLWWIAPDDVDALDCDSEFLVGGLLLVAPVLEQGAKSRDIYLPIGLWEDTLRQDTVIGSQWIRNYPVQLDQIPTFKLLPE